MIAGEMSNFIEVKNRLHDKRKITSSEEYSSYWSFE